MNAVSIYATTWELVFCSKGNDTEAWVSISKHFYLLRKALSCCVCQKILTTPTHDADSFCEHFVCRACISTKMKFNQYCDCCKDPSKFVENNLMRILLNCYQCMCECIANSSLLYKWGHLNAGRNNTLADLIHEGIEIERDPSLTNFGGRMNLMNLDYESPNEVDSSDEDTHNSTVPNGNCSYSENDEEMDDTSRNVSTRLSCNGKESSSKHDPKDFVFKKPNMTVSMMRSFRLKKKGCRCGLATNNPGKLTCCGQRCPCYVEGKACLQCKCRGCRNPHKYVSGNRNSANLNGKPPKELNGSSSARSSALHRRSSNTW